MNTSRKLATLRKSSRKQLDRAGRVSYGVLAWLLGLPLPIIVIAFLWGGCRL